MYSEERLRELYNHKRRYPGTTHLLILQNGKGWDGCIYAPNHTYGKTVEDTIKKLDEAGWKLVEILDLSKPFRRRIPNLL